jgi:GT2 family glycosyltransferase
MFGSAAAVVVTHNREEILGECLRGILSQARPPEGLIVVDNASTDGTADVLRQLGLLPGDADIPPGACRLECEASASDSSRRIRSIYIRLERNTGGAGGFHEGVRVGAEEGYGWLWLLDDDAVAKPDALEKLLGHSVASEPDTVALACRKVDASGQPQVVHCGTFNGKAGHAGLPPESYEQDAVPIDYSSFAGFAVKRDAIAQVGLPRADFFVSYDDVEYSLRLGKLGRLYLVSGSVIVHRDFSSNEEPRKLLGWSVPSEDLELYWHYLCHFRNKLYVLRAYGGMGLAGSLALLARKLVRILLLDDHKWLRMKWTIAYFRDSFRSTFHSLTPDEWRQLVAG